MTPLPRTPLQPARVEATVLRCPVRTPVRTAFGIMHDRPATFVRVEDADGSVGWGEIWCNFPGCGAEHRARLLETVMAPLLVGQRFDGPAEAFETLTARTAVLAIQSGEPGPIAQVIAGIDLALWDLAARRAGQPLWRWLGGAGDGVTVYASGINPDAPEDVVARERALGHRAFKLKIGFDAARDRANLAAVRALLGPDATLMADANQAWTLDEALQLAPRLEPLALAWLEEPLRADRPWAEWQALADATRVPLAAGENLIGGDAFERALATAPLAVVQPDVAKWGGISGNWPVVHRILDSGRRYCPHYLGGGIGLLASAHLLAAVGGNGLLEIDANPNPLRSRLAGPLSTLDDGRARLGDEPGLGVTPDLAALADAAAGGA